jgi:RsiW-degrading membrane proteinase PrsW (M82 family)
MRSVGRHSGDSAQESTYAAPGPPRRRVLFLALVVTLTLVAWGVLVFAAIDFGREARSGEATAWWLLVVATLGGAACLFVTLLVGARIVSLLKGREQESARPQGGRRAAR